MAVASVAARPSIDARALGSVARNAGGRLATARRHVIVPTKARVDRIFAGDAGAMKVAVTGAGGRTGSLVIKRLAESDSFASPKGLVRSTKSADKLRKSLGDLPVELVQGDVSDESALADLCDGWTKLLLKWRAENTTTAGRGGLEPSASEAHGDGTTATKRTTKTKTIKTKIINSKLARPFFLLAQTMCSQNGLRWKTV